MGLEAFFAPIIGAFASTLFSSVIGSGRQSAPAPAPAAAAAPAASQLAKAPTAGAFSAANIAAATSGPASTSLTGASGINPGSLNLGRNTLLGS